MDTLIGVDLIATGNRIKMLRKACGLRVDEISDYMGFTGPQAVYKWQRGDCLPDVCNLLALSRLFHVSMEDILVEYGEGDEPSSVVFRWFMSWISDRIIFRNNMERSIYG